MVKERNIIHKVGSLNFPNYKITILVTAIEATQIGLYLVRYEKSFLAFLANHHIASGLCLQGCQSKQHSRSFDRQFH